jgi:Zn-dependent protease with chaperone function
METPERIDAVAPVRVDPWPSEGPLLVLVLLVSLVAWGLLVLMAAVMLKAGQGTGLIVIGFYAAIVITFVFVSRLIFIAHLRGSAVRLGPGQFPDLFRRVEELARRIGLQTMPAIYLMEAGGALNALATRFFASNFVVLYSDLLEACGGNTQARDMIIAHELGHLKAGHLRLRWLLFPGLCVPFLGSAYSRAREYTCDRYGMSVCEDRAAALRGLAILAAGREHGPQVDLRALARQGDDLDTALMTIGRWLGTHPALVHRIVALERSLAEGSRSGARGPIGAAALIGAAMLTPVVLAVGFAISLPRPRKALEERAEASPGDPSAAPRGGLGAAVDPESAAEQAAADIGLLTELLEEYRAKTGYLPADAEALYGAWRSARPGTPQPVDPFDGNWYGYRVAGDGYYLWSTGPDQKDQTDDIFYVSKRGFFR